MEFKLPIQYTDHVELDAQTIRELELVESEETPIYERFFKPKTPEAVRIAHQYAKYYTKNTEFLEESAQLFKEAPKTVPIHDFVNRWKEIQTQDEFKIKYQYVESTWLNRLNLSPSFLMFLSVYFIASPALFLLSPLFMVLIPFVLLRVNKKGLTWDNYMVIFKGILANHAIGGLLKFNQVDSNKRAYLIGSALFFCIQLYTNIYTFYTFYTNMFYIQQSFDLMNAYLKDTIQRIEHIQKVVRPFHTYKGFDAALEENKTLLTTFFSKSAKVTHSFSHYGTIRCLFYELHDNEVLKNAVHYSFGFHGFLHALQRLKKRIVQKCTFSDTTAFTKAYYPTKAPVKNSYALKNRIITGPNASGKTTLLKTTFINLLLSQQVACGFYRSATVCPYDSLQCYINIPDTSGRDSLFQAEARRCKEIVEEVVKQKRIFCIFDELFSGTNPQEASASVCSLLTFLDSYPTFCFFMTTHFLNVCEELKDTKIEMSCMKSYHLTAGISYVKGGINVLEQLQFPESIVKDARMRTK